MKHAVYISSPSVYEKLQSRHLDETVPPDATNVYGLTKYLSEQVCTPAATQWGVSVNVLRIALPTPDDVWPAWAPPWRTQPASGH